MHRLRMPANEIQRLAVSAIGKLVEFGADAGAAVAALTPLALKARHPQTQQYAIRALKKCGAAAKGGVNEMSMYKKQTLYQQEGKRLISVYPADLPRLGVLLASRLKMFGVVLDKKGSGL